MSARYFVPGLTKPQREAFEQIAIGFASPPATRKSFEKLLERGLIERGADDIVGRDCFGVIAVPQYLVPIPVHMAWCEWCAEQPLTCDTCAKVITLEDVELRGDGMYCPACVANQDVPMGES